MAFHNGMSFYDVCQAQRDLRQHAAEVSLQYMKIRAHRGNESVEELSVIAEGAKRFCQDHMGMETNQLVTFFLKRRCDDTTPHYSGRPLRKNPGFQHVEENFVGTNQGECFLSWVDHVNDACLHKSTSEEVSYILQHTDGKANALVTNIFQQAIDEAKYAMWLEFATVEKVAKSLLYRLECFQAILEDHYVQDSLTKLTVLCRKILHYKSYAPEILNQLDTFNPGVLKLTPHLHQKWWQQRVAASNPLNFSSFVLFLEQSLLHYMSDPSISVNQEVPKPIQVFVLPETLQCVFPGHTAHTTVECRMFHDMAIHCRRALVRIAGSCFRCFEKHHLGDCNSTGICWVCNSSKHHVLLHY